MKEMARVCCASIPKFVKVCLALTIILVLIGIGVGTTRVWEVRQERNDINTINESLEEKGLNDQAKSLISAFIAKNPNTRNIVITDKEDNIVYSANYEAIEGKTKFILEKDADQTGVYGLKDGRNKFKRMGQMEDKKDMGFGFIMPNRSDRMNQGPKMMQGKEMPMNRLKSNMPFLNSFKINDNLNIYYISEAFRENVLSNVMMITCMLLRLLSLVFWILIAVWIYRDSKARGLNRIFWGIVGIITGILGLVIYLIYRHTIVFCSVCKNKVNKDANFCANCGEVVKSKCESCGQIVSSRENYCPACGTKKDKIQK